MKTCELMTYWCEKLDEIFKSCPKIAHMVITEPTAVQRFPHPTTIRKLTLESIPPHRDDWDWLKTLTDLTEVDVSVREGKDGTAHLSIHEAKANLIKVTKKEAAETLILVLNSLNGTLLTKV